MFIEKIDNSKSSKDLLDSGSDKPDYALVLSGLCEIWCFLTRSVRHGTRKSEAHEPIFAYTERACAANIFHT